MNKYRLTFDFLNTIEQAQEYKKTLLIRFKNNKYYMRKYANKISYNNWTSKDGTENKILIWYYY